MNKIHLYIYAKDLIAFQCGDVVPAMTQPVNRMVEVILDYKYFKVASENQTFIFIRRTTLRERLSMTFHKEKWRKQ